MPDMHPVVRTRVRAARAPFSPVTLAVTLVAILGLAYITLIAVVMSYGALTVSFSQSVRDTEASVAALEARYLAQVSTVTVTDYAALGYEKPVKEFFVPRAVVTALR